MEFSEKDAADVAKLKQVMFDKAADGDALAARAFASLLNAETERSKAIAAPAQEKPAALAAVPSSWQESISAKMPEAEARAVA